MALTPSTMMPLSTTAPDFDLHDSVTGKSVNLQDAKGSNGTLVMFICNHCPYVVHLQSALGQLGSDYPPSGINIIAISANDVHHYPQDGPKEMTAFAQQNGFNFPYLYDESQSVAKSYDAACTPDFFLFDSDLKCVYRGQFDNSRPKNNIPVTGKDLRGAMDALINNEGNGNTINQDQTASVGCNIKWK